MAQFALPGVYRVVARQVLGEEEAINIFHALKTDPGADVFDLKQEIARFYLYDDTGPAPDRGIRDLLSNDTWALDYVSTQDMSTVPWPDPTVESYGNAGLDGTAALPPQTSLVISWSSTLGGRSGRGRTYLTGFTETGSVPVVNGVSRPSPLVLSTVGDAVGDLFTRLGAANWSLEVVSDVMETSATIVQARIKNLWRTQRRRAEDLAATTTVTVTP